MVARSLIFLKADQQQSVRSWDSRTWRTQDDGPPVAIPLIEEFHVRLRPPSYLGRIDLTYQAVEIGGEYYWDGGYTANPALAPLYLRTTATDVVIIGINPLLRAEVHRTAREIISRIDEISFNSAFISDLAAIAFIKQIWDRRPQRIRSSACSCIYSMRKRSMLWVRQAR